MASAWEEGAQKPWQPAQEKGEVVAGGGEHGIDAVAIAALKMIAVHTMLGLQCGRMTGSTAARRFISRRIALVTRRA